MWRSRYAMLVLLSSIISLNTHSQSACESVRVQAEDYQAMNGIQTQATADSGGGLNVGWTDGGDWLSYNITLPASGTYEVSYRVASADANGGILQLEANSGQTLYGSISIPSTGAWQSWTTVSHTVQIPNSGSQDFGIAIIDGGINLNWVEFKALNCGGSSNCESIFIEAESYSQMSGIQTEATSDAGGGLNVGWIDANDWMTFPSVNIPSTEIYDFEYRVASPNSGASFLLEGASGSQVFDNVSVPNTGGWQNWTSVNGSAVLNAGTVDFGVNATAGGWNINWIKATPASCDSSEPNPGLTAKTAAEQMGKGFNLGQMFEGTQHPRTLAAASAKIDAYYNMGFRNVRIPVTWTEAVGGNLLVNDANVGSVNRGHQRLAIIESVVDYALSKPGMYVVLNVHHEHTLKTNNRWWVLETLWADIADIFKTRDHRLLFEILNEPHKEDANKSPMAASDLRYMTGKAYDQIRAVDAQRIVIIGGNQWFGAHEVPAVWTNLNEVGGGADKYVMATFHHYDPWSFNGDNQGDYADNWTNSNINDPMDIMQNWANGVGQGMPVYIGEWGTGWGSRYSGMSCNNIRYWYQLFDSQYASSKTQPTSVWDDGGWFKIFDHSTNSFNNNLAECIGGTCAWTGGERFNSGCN